MGGQGGPIICDFAPIHYLLTDKIPIYCLPLQYQFSDYLPDSDKWTIGQLDKYPITKRTALCAPMYNVTMCSYTIKWFLASGGHQPRVTSNARPQGYFWDLSEPDPPSISLYLCQRPQFAMFPMPVLIKISISVRRVFLLLHKYRRQTSHQSCAILIGSKWILMLISPKTPIYRYRIDIVSISSQNKYRDRYRGRNSNFLILISVSRS